MELSGDLDARAIDALLASPSSWSAANKVVVDMRGVSVAKPAGACLLVCFLAEIVERRTDYVVPVEIVRPPRAVSSYLATLGFFSALSKKIVLVGCDDLLAEDKRRQTCRSESDRARPLGATRDSSVSRTVVLPIQFLPSSHKAAHPWEFEGNCGAFVNSLADKFEHLFQSGHSSGVYDAKSFWNAIVELLKNVFDHSEGWGLAAISASPRLGSIVTFHDVGVGIPTTVRRCFVGEYTPISDEEALRWSLIEGNSSKPGNSGLGLHIVERFVAEANGVMEVRSGTCRLRRLGDSAGWQASVVPPFGGTHVSFHVPFAP
jgi:ABC-type transporter Mla MlaB component